MAYEYDRFEREEGGGSFLMGLLAGTVLMAGLTTYAAIVWVDFGGRRQALSVAPQAAGAVVTWSGKL